MLEWKPRLVLLLVALASLALFVSLLKLGGWLEHRHFRLVDQTRTRWGDQGDEPIRCRALDLDCCAPDRQAVQVASGR